MQNEERYFLKFSFIFLLSSSKWKDWKKRKKKMKKIRMKDKKKSWLQGIDFFLCGKKKCFFYINSIGSKSFPILANFLMNIRVHVSSSLAGYQLFSGNIAKSISIHLIFFLYFKVTWTILVDSTINFQIIFQSS